MLRAAFPGNPLALFPSFRQSNGDCLLPALHAAGPAAAAAPGGSALIAVHLPLDLGPRAAGIPATSGCLASTPLRHFALRPGTRGYHFAFLRSCGEHNEIRSGSLPES